MTWPTVSRRTFRLALTVAALYGLATGLSMGAML